METARLRAMQDKVNDRQAELDELRARRHQEAGERAWRDRERKAAERQKALVEDLHVAREHQMAAKVQDVAEMARAEKETFERVLLANLEKERELADAAAKDALMRRRHQQDLLAQIHDHEERAKKARAEFLEEGRRERAAHEKERVRLGAIKERKLAELRESGVPDKYMTELLKMKV